MRTLPLTCVLLALALPLSAQDDEVRPILQGERAAIVFSPEGG